MKAKIFSILIAFGIVTIFSGCQTSYLNQPSSSIDLVSKAHIKPDISVGDKIKATATVHRLFGFFGWGPKRFAEGVNYTTSYKEEPISKSLFVDTIARAKAGAAYRACAGNKADFIIFPRYYIIVENYFVYKKTKAKVYGYKGVVKGIQKADKD